MEYPIIRTAEELRKAMSDITTEAVTDDNLVWFVCIVNSRMVIDSYSTKDIASMFRDGVKPTTIEDVQPFIDTYYEDYEEETDEYKLQSLYLLRQVFDFYGDDAEDLDEQIEELQ